MNSKEYDAAIAQAQAFANQGRPDLISKFVTELQAQGVEDWILDQIGMLGEAAIISATAPDPE